MSICPTSVFGRFGLSLCWSELLVSGILLIAIIAVVLVWIRGISTAQEPLLGDYETVAYHAHIQSYQSIARAILILLVIDSLVQVVLDAFQHFHPAIATAVSGFATLHLVTSLIVLFSWIVCCVFYYFVSLKQVQRFLVRKEGVGSQMLRFWCLAMVLELVRTYHWILTAFSQGT
jgi:hypothetical protein